MRRSTTITSILLILLVACVFTGLWLYRWPGILFGLFFSLAVASFCATVALRGRYTKFRDTAIRYQAMFESDIVGLTSSDRSGKLIRANNYFLRVIGYTREEFEKKLPTWQQLTPPELHARSYQAMDEAIAKGSALPYEKEYIRKDGTRVPVLVGQVFLKPRTFVTFVLNITDRKKQELLIEKTRANLETIVAQRTEALRSEIDAREKTNEEVRQSRMFLDSVIENIPNMIFVKDAKELRFVRFNRAGEDLIGQKTQDIIGKNDYDFFPKDQADFFTTKDRHVLESRVEFDIPEEPITTPRGVRILHTKKIPILDSDGEPKYLLGISEDITERKAAETARISLLREQAARIEAERSAEQLRFFDHASAALGGSLDIDSMLTAFARIILGEMANAIQIEIFREDAETKRVTLPGGSDLPELFKNLMKSSLRTGKTECETDGTISVITAPLLSHGRNLGTLGLLSTQPGHSYGEYEISIVRDLAKRTAFAVENAMLFIKAQEANRAKSSFLANMSHEIRTPLGAMLGFADLLCEAELPSEQAEYVNTILRNGRQLLRIVDEILDLSKVESEHMEVERLSFSLPKLFDDVLALLEIRAKEKEITLSLEVAPDVPSVVATDPTRLRQILLNVIGNAIKFTDHGFVKVGVGTSRSDRGQNILEIHIRDSGIGITPEQKARLFQPFAQADDSTTRKFGGTGLGLVLSQKLARLLGGDLQLVDTQPGSGSHFLVTLEIKRLETARITPPTPPAKAPPRPVPNRPGDHSHRPKRLLVVDDSDDNRVLVHHHLKRMGIPIDIDFAENGREGVDKASRKNYDLVLMDIQMPNMDGFEAVAELRNRGFRQPVIALTAHAMKGYRERCIDAGFNGYICKPIQKEVLFETLDEYGMGPRSSSPSTGPSAPPPSDG